MWIDHDNDSTQPATEQFQYGFDLAQEFFLVYLFFVERECQWFVVVN